MLKRLEDLTPFDWIADVTLAMPTEPYSCQSLQLHCFPTYSKLFHPIYVDATVTDLSISWHQAERADKQSSDLVSGGTLVRGLSKGQPNGERMRWRDLASRYGLVFHPEINEESLTRAFADRSWPRYLIGPEEGTLDLESTESLISVLAPITELTACFFQYSELSAKGFERRLYRGNLTDVLSFFDIDDVFATPEYWWPENREWCVCTDWDLSFTLIGGSQAVRDAIAKHPLLETLPVTPMSRVDYKADELNGSRDQSA